MSRGRIRPSVYRTDAQFCLRYHPVRYAVRAPDPVVGLAVSSFDEIDDFPLGCPNKTGKSLLGERDELTDRKAMRLYRALLSWRVRVEGTPASPRSRGAWCQYASRVVPVRIGRSWRCPPLGPRIAYAL